MFFKAGHARERIFLRLGLTDVTVNVPFFDRFYFLSALALDEAPLCMQR